MKIQGAVIKEQGIKFSIVIVKQHVIKCVSDRDVAIRQFSALFGNMPLVLMAQDHNGTPTYFGRKDIVNFLRNVYISQIPWSEYQIS
ncbi:hypothetical protein MJH12_12735 [bacterium]|nr:hypothetical protein [bacterium]